MSTIELIEHLTAIFMEIVLPLVVLWIGYSIKQWLPKEGTTHEKVSDLVEVLAVFLRAEAAAKAQSLQAAKKPDTE